MNQMFVVYQTAEPLERKSEYLHWSINEIKKTVDNVKIVIGIEYIQVQ